MNQIAEKRFRRTDNDTYHHLEFDDTERMGCFEVCCIGLGPDEEEGIEGLKAKVRKAAE